MARIMLRIAAAMLGLTAAVTALLIPILVYHDESNWTKLYPKAHRTFWHALGLYTPLFIAIGLLCDYEYPFGVSLNET